MNLLLKQGWLGRVDVQGIARTDPATRDSFVQQKKLAFPVALDSGQAQAMGITMWPTTIVIPADGGTPTVFQGEATTADIRAALEAGAK